MTLGTVQKQNQIRTRGQSFGWRVSRDATHSSYWKKHLFARGISSPGVRQSFSSELSEPKRPRKVDLTANLSSNLAKFSIVKPQIGHLARRIVVIIIEDSVQLPIVHGFEKL